MVRGVTVILALVLGALASWQAAVEFRAIRQMAQSDAGLLETVRHFAPVLSVRSQESQLRRCFDVQYSAANSRANPEDRTAFARACLARADDVLATSPTRAIAQLARASALAVLDQPEAARMALEAARSSAPNQGWQASRRMILALDLVRKSGSGTPQSSMILAKAAADVGVLLSDASLARELAKTYRVFVLSRQWITMEVEALPPEKQELFLNAVKREMSIVGGES